MIRWAGALTVVVCGATGCYLTHELGAPHARDAGPDLPPPRADAGTGCAVRPSCDAVPPVTPLLRYAFEHGLASTGAAAVPDGVAAGPTTYVAGASGSALELPLGAHVTLPGTAALLAGRSALTFSAWTRRSSTDLEGRTFLGCRTDTRGFEAYFSYLGLTTCGGFGGAPPPWGGCATVTECAPWTHFVLRWSRGSEPEVAVDGGAFAPVRAGVPISSLALFDGVRDLYVGDGAGDGGGAAGRFDVDDVRVYDTRLDDATVWPVTACPSP